MGQQCKIKTNAFSFNVYRKPRISRSKRETKNIEVSGENDFYDDDEDE